jgi:hypothetical protein
LPLPLPELPFPFPFPPPTAAALSMIAPPCTVARSAAGGALVVTSNCSASLADAIAPRAKAGPSTRNAASLAWAPRRSDFGAGNSTSNSPRSTFISPAAGVDCIV